MISSDYTTAAAGLYLGFEELKMSTLRGLKI